MHGLDRPLDSPMALSIAHGRTFEDDFSHERAAGRLQDRHEHGLLVVLDDDLLVPEAGHIAAHSPHGEVDFRVIDLFVRDSVGKHAATDPVVRDKDWREARRELTLIVLCAGPQKPVVE